LNNLGTSISLLVPSNYAGGQLEVSAANACGSSSAKTNSISARPEITTLSGPTKICNNSQATYTAVSQPGTTFQWSTSFLQNVTIETTPSGTSKATGSVGSPSSSVFGVVLVYAVNACGSSAGRNIDIKTIPCRQSLDLEGETASNLASPEFVVFPNPGNGKFNLKATELSGAGTLEVYNSTGVLVKQVQISELSIPNVLDLTKEAPGLYRLSIKTEGFSKNINLFKD
jgi:hypothetical protein